MEEARNNLESYLYKLRDLLGDDSETPFMKCSQPGERSAIRNRLDETLIWMHDEADEADTAQFLEKLAGLEYEVSTTFCNAADPQFLQEPRTPNCSQIQGSRRVPQGPQQFADVELVLSVVHHRGQEKSYGRG